MRCGAAADAADAAVCRRRGRSAAHHVASAVAAAAAAAPPVPFIITCCGGRQRRLHRRAEDGRRDGWGGGEGLRREEGRRRSIRRRFRASSFSPRIHALGRHAAGRNLALGGAHKGPARWRDGSRCRSCPGSSPPAGVSLLHVFSFSSFFLKERRNEKQRGALYFFFFSLSAKKKTEATRGRESSKNAPFLVFPNGATSTGGRRRSLCIHANNGESSSGHFVALSPSSIILGIRATTATIDRQRSSSSSGHRHRSGQAPPKVSGPAVCRERRLRRQLRFGQRQQLREQVAGPRR